MDAVAASYALNQPPDGVIESPDGDLTIRPGTTVPFAGRTSDPEGLPVSYLWQFGGAAPDAFVEDPGDVVFPERGEYTVRFTVVDAFGVADPTPAERVIRVRSGGGGGGCAVASGEPDGSASVALGAGALLLAAFRSSSRRRARCRI